MNNKKNCFIDFDGTIVCNKDRIYEFFIKNINPKYKDSLTKDEFWSLKKMGINEIDWLNSKYKDNICKKKWDDKKKNFIENEEYLKFNIIFEYSLETLKYLSEKYNLILVTRRSNKEGIFKELENLKIKNIFYKILVVPHDKESKSKYIINQNIKINKEDIFIGDTEDDIKAALELGVNPYFVKSGIRSEWIIRKEFYQYNINIIENIKDLVKWSDVNGE